MFVFSFYSFIHVCFFFSLKRLGTPLILLAIAQAVAYKFPWQVLIPTHLRENLLLVKKKKKEKKRKKERERHQ